MKDSDVKDIVEAAKIAGAELLQSDFWQGVEAELAEIEGGAKSTPKVEPRLTKGS